MVSWRRGLAVLSVMVALAVIGNSFIFAFEREPGQFIWDYIADPLVIVVLFVVTLVNVIDSLLIRTHAGSHLTQLPRDIVTALVAIVGFRYLLQYLAKMSPAQDPVSALWDYLVAIVIVVLFFEAISLWRSDNR